MKNALGGPVRGLLTQVVFRTGSPVYTFHYMHLFYQEELLFLKDLLHQNSHRVDQRDAKHGFVVSFIQLHFPRGNIQLQLDREREQNVSSQQSGKFFFTLAKKVMFSVVLLFFVCLLITLLKKVITGLG